jgi:hypothetical protein
MPRGGFRPGAGRKKGSRDKKKRIPSPETEEKRKIREMLSYDVKAKAKFYQEFLVRVSKGEALSITEKKLMDKLGAELAAQITDPQPEEEIPVDITPVDFLRNIMLDKSEDMNRRMRAAEILAKHDLGPKKGKKEQKADRAKAAGSGKFAPAKPPLALVK